MFTYLEPFVLLEPPAQNTGCSCVMGQYWNGVVSFSCFSALKKFFPGNALDPQDPSRLPLDPLWTPHFLLNLFEGLRESKQGLEVIDSHVETVLRPCG